MTFRFFTKGGEDVASLHSIETIDIITESGEITGKIIPIKEIHKKEYWHKAVHVWLVNSENKILLQLRSIKVDNFPGQWDSSAAGHVLAGENSLTAAARETKEEMGLSLASNNFIFIGKIIKSTKRENPLYINNEFYDIYLVKKDIDISDLNLQESEVSEFKYFPLNNLKKMVALKDSSLVPHDEDYNLLFKIL